MTAEATVEAEATRAATSTLASILLAGRVNEETNAAARMDRVTAEPGS